MSDEPMIVQWAEAAIGRNDNSHTTIAKANLRELLAHERALRTIAAQLAEALAALAGNEINADHPWPRTALEAWETYQR